LNKILKLEILLGYVDPNNCYIVCSR